MGLTKVKGVVLANSVDTVADLATANKGSAIQVLGFHTKGDGGGGVFFYEAGESKANHNGGTVIDPAKAGLVADWATNQEAYFTAGSGTGVWKREYSGAVNVKWFGAISYFTAFPSGDESTAFDNTIVLQHVLNLSSKSGAFTSRSKSFVVQFTPNTFYYFLGTVYLPSYITLDLNGATIQGIGTNTFIESGYFVGDAVVSNFSSPNETRFVVHSNVKNGTISNFNKAFRLFNFCEASFIRDIRFYGCNQAVYAVRCFYSSYYNLHSRQPLDNQAYPCFHLHDAVNAIEVSHCFVEGYNIGWEISGSKDNCLLLDISAENCATGVSVENSTSGLSILNGYFEGNYNAIDFQGTGNHSNILVEGCWFFGVTNAVEGTTIVSGNIRRNTLNGAAYNLATNFSNRLVVDTSLASFPDSLPSSSSVPSGLGDTCFSENIATVFNTATGLALFKVKDVSGFHPLAVRGSTGSPKSGTVPGCSVTINNTSAKVTTNIIYNFFESFSYVLEVYSPSEGVFTVSGRVIGSTIFPNSAQKPVNLSNEGGKFALNIGGFSANIERVTGLIRLV
jgi:hypothetical protein